MLKILTKSGWHERRRYRGKHIKFLFCTLCLQYLWEFKLFSEWANKAYQSGADVNCRFKNIKAQWIVGIEIGQYVMWSSGEESYWWRPRECLPSGWKWRWAAGGWNLVYHNIYPHWKANSVSQELHQFYFLESRTMPDTTASQYIRMLSKDK